MIDLSSLLWPLIAPQIPREVAAFYMFWVIAYTTVYLVWDIRSKHTPAFHLSHLQYKIPAVVSGMTLASSLLLLVSPFDTGVRSAVDAAVAPIILAGLAGLFVSISSICPYRAPAAKADEKQAGVQSS